MRVGWMVRAEDGFVPDPPLTLRAAETVTIQCIVSVDLATGDVLYHQDGTYIVESAPCSES